MPTKPKVKYARADKILSGILGNFDKLSVLKLLLKLLFWLCKIFELCILFELLKLFIENPNKVFSREEILKLVWHDDVCVLDRTVDVNITRVRKKIGQYGANLVSRQGYGYSFKS